MHWISRISLAIAFAVIHVVGSPGAEALTLPLIIANCVMSRRISQLSDDGSTTALVLAEMEQAALAGDPPTERLETDWRERCEDVVWAFVNSPEFVGDRPVPITDHGEVLSQLFS